MILLRAALRRLPVPAEEVRRALPAYALGGVSAYWLIEGIAVAVA